MDDSRRKLTKREGQIMDLLVAGLTVKSVAERLSISEHTVRTHTKRIYRKLQVSGRVEAVLAYLEDQTPEN